MGEIAIKKKAITTVLSCFVVLVILMSVLPFFVTQSNAVMPVDIYMGKVTGKNNDVLTVQIEYKPDYSNPHNWVSYSAISQWTISNSNAINEIRVGDYIEIAGLLGVDNEGESICIGKMKSSTEKIITDVYGDPGYLVPVHTFIEHPGVLNPPLLGDYIITYENIPDCSKYPSGSFACNVEAKYSDVTISKGNEQLQSQRLYPGRSFKYEDKGRGYNIDITFNSGEAPAYPDCTDQPCLGPQAFSDFTIHIKKIEEKMPDLIIQDISWNPSNPKEGDTVTFTVTVKNQGSGSAGYSYVYYYIGGSYVDSDYVPSLSAGSTSTQSFTWTEKYVPQMSARKTVSAAEWKVPKAFPIVKACADATDLVDESNEDNNCREETVEIYEEKKTDLIIEDITWSPSKLKQGDTITFTVKIKNRGDGNAGTSTVKYYIDGSDVDSDIVPSLSVGSTSTQSFTWKANKCGDVKVKAVADATNAVDEGNNENNNVRIETININCPPKEKPDLTIQSISVSPENLKLGDNAKFAVTVKNIGKETAGKSHVFIVGINRGANKELFRIEDSCPSLKPGEIYTYSKNAKMENCGEYQLKAWADAQNEVNESNEENNYEDASFEIPCEKLELEKIWITGQDEIKAGETLQWQAYGSYSDGSQKKLTNQVSWTADPSDILQNKGNGEFKGLKGGEATLKITYEGKSATKKVTVKGEENQPPKASFTYEKDGLTVHFTSTSSDPDGNIKNYLWLFGDGGKSNQENPIHIYNSEGTYTIVLVVWDDKGLLGSYSEDITVTEPKLPVVIWVKNVNNAPLPACGGEITVKAYEKLEDIAEDIFFNGHIAEKTVLYEGGSPFSVVSMSVPKDTKFIRVLQKPNIEDGIKEYWGSAEISPPGVVVFFTRHTPWLYDIDFDLRSPYTQYINMDVNKEKHIDTTVSNPGSLDKKVKIRLILDRDMKLDKDMKYDSDDIGPEDGFEVPSDETDWITFRYRPREDGIWKFRAVVRTLYDDKYWIVTDQHDWYLILAEKPIIREASIGVFATVYNATLCQTPQEAFDEEIKKAWAIYSDEIGKITIDAIKASSPFLGSIDFGNSYKKGIEALVGFAHNAMDAWKERKFLNAIGECRIYSDLCYYSNSSCTEKRIKCWKDKDIDKIGKQLINEAKMFARLEGFSEGVLGFPHVPDKIESMMKKLHESAAKEYDATGQLYYDLYGLEKFDRNKDSLFRTETYHQKSAKSCAEDKLRGYFDVPSP